MKFKTLAAPAIVLALLVSGCASKPPAVDEPLEPAVVEPVIQAPTVTKAEVDELHAKVLAARKEAFDFGAKERFADDYAAAEARYLSGKAALDESKLPEAKAELEAALPLFTSLADRAALASAQDKRGVSAEAKRRAQSAGAEARSPEAFARAEALAAEAEAALAAGDARKALALYADAVYAYDAAEKRSRAVVVKGNVDELGFAGSDAGNYAIAEEKLAAVNRLIAEKPADANDAAAESLLRFNIVLRRGWELGAGARRAAAAAYKRDADAIKAAVAVRDDYTRAEARWNLAATAYAAENFEAAAALYAEAEELFKLAYGLAADKRAAAERAIQAATERTARSEAVAREGDQIIGEPGSDRQGE